MKKQLVDTYLISINIAFLVGYFFVFQAALGNILLRTLVLISFIGLCLSLILLIWHLFRFPIRLKLFDELKNETIEKSATRIAAFIEDIILPATRLKTRDDIRTKALKIKDEKGFLKFQSDLKKEIKRLESDLKSSKTEGSMDESMEVATRYVLESFINNLVTSSRNDSKKAFGTPLNERHAKLKYRIDIIAKFARRQIFAGSVVLCIFSIGIKIILS